MTNYYGGSSGVIRSLNNGALVNSILGGLGSTTGFGRIDASSGSYVAGNQYHFGFLADAEF